MSLKEYISRTIAEFFEAEGTGVPGVREIAFDIGIADIRRDGKDILVVRSDSTNRVKFTLEVKRK